MSATNLLAWSVQIALLSALAAALAAILRVHVPSGRLFYWQMVLLACLALPLLGPWQQSAITETVSFSTTTIPVAQAAAPRRIPLGAAVMWLIAAGMVARAGWLALGFRRLRQHRRRSLPFAFREGVALLLSREIASPVTFGVFRPVVLLPVQFPELAPRIREAILCHELEHVRRRDWLFTVAEESVRTVFWFHPAVWWVLGQIQLAREQTVDHRVIERTRSREEYVDALLAIAGGKLPLDLALAPLFLRRRHLKKRVVSILQEFPMHKTRSILSLAAGLALLAAGCLFVPATFPLRAAPALAADAPGVTVQLGQAALMHRAPVSYPDAARQQGIQGAVIVQVKVDAGGNVADAQVLSGPDELRKAALESVLNWHFTKDSAKTMQQVTIAFQLPAETPETPAQAARLAARGQAQGQAPQPLTNITILGLSEQARADLLSRLQVHEGDMFGPAQSLQVTLAVKEFDEHLTIVRIPVAAGGSALTIGPKEMLQEIFPISADQSTGPQRIRVGGNVQALKLITKIPPVYPPSAKQVRLEGQVALNAVLAKDGTVQSLTLISGHPLLASAAMDAVRQWVYETTLLNGNPVEVVCRIDVNFTLAR